MTAEESSYFTLILIAVGCLIFGIIGWAIGTKSGHGAAGFMLGILLGPIGIIVTAILTATAKPQPVHYSPAPRPVDLMPLHETPDHLTIARDGQVIGTWPLADVLDYLTTGQLQQSDYYLHRNGTTWIPLRRLA